jgi:hypothetical protein
VSNANTPHEVLKAGVTTIIAGMTLVSDDGSLSIGQNVYNQMLADETVSKWPNVLVTTEGLREEPFAGDTNNIWTWFPVAVGIMDRDAKRTPAREGDYFAWRLAIKQMFHQKVDTVDLSVCYANGVLYTNNWCEVRHGSILEQEPRAKEFLKSSLTLRFQIIETRLT